MTPALWYVAVYSLLMGGLLPIWWLIALTGRQVPEIESGGREIWFHITAELVTGLTLVAGGAAILAAPGAGWSALLSALGLGMIVYTLIQSPGHYVEHRDPAMLGMFGAVWAATIPALILRFW